MKSQAEWDKKKASNYPRYSPVDLDIALSDDQRNISRNFSLIYVMFKVNSVAQKVDMKIDV